MTTTMLQEALEEAAANDEPVYDAQGVKRIFFTNKDFAELFMESRDVGRAVAGWDFLTPVECTQRACSHPSGLGRSGRSRSFPPLPQPNSGKQ
jgi:hypothetical protein